MVERREYELTDEELDTLLDACKPVLAMLIGNVRPPSPQENAEAAWVALGHKKGFDGMTARPVPGKSMNFFTAEPREPEEA